MFCSHHRFVWACFRMPSFCVLLGDNGGEVWTAVSRRCLLEGAGSCKSTPAWQMTGIVGWGRKDVLVFHQVEAFLLQWIFSTAEQDDKQHYHRTLKWKQVLWCTLFTWHSPIRDIYMRQKLLQTHSFISEGEWVPHKGSLLHECGLCFSREAGAGGRKSFYLYQKDAVILRVHISGPSRLLAERMYCSQMTDGRWRVDRQVDDRCMCVFL